MVRKNSADHPFSLITTPTFKLPDGEKPDVFHRCASDMACVHNMLIRGLNSIYLQAPHVKPQDEKSFLYYSTCFYELLHVHHGGEEADLFPKIEEMSGEKGLMSRNVEQHHAFHQGLEDYHAYIVSCLKGTEKYDGTKLIGIIDGFGTTLVEHLADEITTILDLVKYKDKMGKLEKVFEAFDEKDTKQLPIAGTLSWGFFNHDKEYEDGLWADWPPAPAAIVFIVRRITYHIHSDWWKFASCDPWGRPREKLYAVPDN